MQRLGRLSTTQQVIFVPVVLLLYLVVAGPIGWLQFGEIGGIAALAATCVCLVACVLAQLTTSQISVQTNLAGHVLLGIGIRTALPLMTCLLLTTQSHRIVDAGFVWFLLGAYCVGLTSETVLNVSKLKESSANGAARPG